MPDLTVILDLPVAEGLARAAARGIGSAAAGDRFERRDRAFHERLRQGFLAIARTSPERCAVIDAGAEVAAVHRAVLAVVAQRAGVVFG